MKCVTRNHEAEGLARDERGVDRLSLIPPHGLQAQPRRIPSARNFRTATVPAFANPPVGARANNLQGRINQGVASGELTGREAARLQRQENHLRREITRDRIDGGLSAAERAKIQHQENRLNRRVYVQKHDGQSR